MKINDRLSKVITAFLCGVFASIPVFFAIMIALSEHPVAVDSEENIPILVKYAEPSIVKAGQVWAHEHEGQNPFSKEHTRKRVVAVKNGYVKYFFVGQEHYGDWAAQSAPVGYFVEYQKLISR